MRVRLWVAETGALEATLERREGDLTFYVFSPNGERIVTAGEDITHTVRLWDAVAGTLLTLVGHTGGVNRCAFSPDGRHLAMAGWDGTARLWDAETAALLLTLEGRTGRVLSCAFSPDGKRVLTASHDGTARLWHVAL